MAKDNEKNEKPPVADARDAEIADLKSQLAEQGEAIKKLTGLIEGGAVNTRDALQEEKSRREQAEFAAEVAKGKQKITQEAADARFPNGKFRFTCSLADGNDHPEIVIGADNEVDAAARYMAVCGIRSTEKQVSVLKA